MRIIILIIMIAFSISAGAFQNEKPLDNSKDETRAQKIFKQIRCLVCEGESLAESNADLAINMRDLIREKVAAGESDKHIRQYLVWRYGESILQKPPFSAGTYVLWFLPLILLVGGVIMIARAIKFKKHERTRSS